MSYQKIITKVLCPLAVLLIFFFLQCNFSIAGQSFILLIDNSETMNSDQNGYVLDAATLVVDLLNVGDRISVVGFSKKPKVIIKNEQIVIKSKYKRCKTIREEIDYKKEKKGIASMLDIIKSKITYNKKEKKDIIGMLNIIKSKIKGLDSETTDLERHLILITDGKLIAESNIGTSDELENALQTYIDYKIPIHIIAIGKNEGYGLLSWFTVNRTFPILK